MAWQDAGNEIKNWHEVLAVAVFDCPNCGRWMHVERDGAECPCGRRYRVQWSVVYVTHRSGER